MVKELEPTPTSTPESKKKLPAHEVLQNYPPPRRRGRGASNGRVSFADYEKMLADRPEKFTAEQVGYRKADEVGKQCGQCIHLYKEVVGDQRTVCEILRLDPEDSINPEFVCMFTSRDGVEYPYVKKDSNQEPARETKEGGSQ